MKNIAIFGGSRSGKSTLARMISKKYPNYQIIIGDDIRWAFQTVLPQNNINTSGGIGMQDDFPNFLSCLFDKSIGRNKDAFNYIIETCDITPGKANKLFNRADTVLLFLGTPRKTADEYFKEIRRYQTKRDWTYDRSDEHILEHCRHWIDKSKEYEEECRKLNIWFVDTSFDRDKVLKHTMKAIEEKCSSRDN